METWGPLLSGIGALLATLAAAMAAMAWIYRREGIDTVLFITAIAASSDSAIADASPAKAPPASLAYANGCHAFEDGRYRAAVSAFETAIAAQADWPEAHHNLGLSLANLRDDTTATAALVRAGELYLQLDNRQGSALVRRHLSAILDRKRAREGSSANAA